MPHYLTNRDLAEEIRKCQETNEVSDKLARMLMLLVDRIALKPNWRNYSYISDMRGDALLQLIKRNQSNGPIRRNDQRPNILKFSFEYAERAGKPPNPFAYATQIIMNAFRRAVKLEAALGELRDDLLEEENMAPSARRQGRNEDLRSAEPILKRPRGRPRTKA